MAVAADALVNAEESEAAELAEEVVEVYILYLAPVLLNLSSHEPHGPEPSPLLLS